MQVFEQIKAQEQTKQAELKTKEAELRVQAEQAAIVSYCCCLCLLLCRLGAEAELRVQAEQAAIVSVKLCWRAGLFSCCTSAGARPAAAIGAATPLPRPLLPRPCSNMRRFVGRSSARLCSRTRSRRRSWRSTRCVVL